MIFAKAVHNGNAARQTLSLVTPAVIDHYGLMRYKRRVARVHATKISEPRLP